MYLCDCSSLSCNAAFAFNAVPNSHAKYCLSTSCEKAVANAFEWDTIAKAMPECAISLSIAIRIWPCGIWSTVFRSWSKWLHFDCFSPFKFGWIFEDNACLLAGWLLVRIFVLDHAGLKYVNHVFFPECITILRHVWNFLYCSSNKPQPTSEHKAQLTQIFYAVTPIENFPIKENLM